MMVESRDELRRRIIKQLRFPLLDPELEEIMDVIDEQRSAAWDKGYQQACDDINWERPWNTRKVTSNPYKRMESPQPESQRCFGCGQVDGSHGAGICV